MRVLSFPFNVLLETLFKIFRFAVDLIRADPATHDPILEVESFVREFEEKYGVAHPPFHRGSYVQALNEAKRELKFLLVFLHAHSDPDSELFCSRVLTHSAVVSYVTRHRQLLLWSCGTRSYEGFKVSQSLRESSHAPLLALIVQREDGLMRLVRKFDVRGASVERFVSQVEQGICDNESYVASAREERQARIMNQEIRRQQDQDYEKSLEADRAKEREKQEERRRKESEERAKQEALAAAARRQQQLATLRIQLRDNLPPEPSPEETDVVRILIKLPDGSRLERRFKRTDSIRTLYQFVYSHDAAPTRFQVVSNFPRKELPCVSPTPENPDCFVEGREAASFAQVGLGRNETLFVHDLEA